MPGPGPNCEANVAPTLSTDVTRGGGKAMDPSSGSVDPGVALMVFCSDAAMLLGRASAMAATSTFLRSEIDGEPS